jgi:peptide/nickel transport system permease protein
MTTLNDQPLGATRALGSISSASIRVDSPRSRTFRRFRRHRLAVCGLLVLISLTLIAIFAPVVGRHDPNRGDLLRIDQPPTWSHPLGTDGNGRDYWSRLVYGARVSLSVGLIATALAGVVGTILGAISGYFGGKVDTGIQRFTEMVMTFPTLMILITIVAYVGSSIFNIMIAIGLIGWTSFCRMVRGQVLSLREQTFIEAARVLGVHHHRILLRHILPNVLPYIVVLATLNFAGIILLEAGLSFLGLGVQPPTPSWGNMLQQAQTYDVLVSKPWRWMAPGIAIALCVLAINFVGDGLRDALDPRSKRG